MIFTGNNPPGGFTNTEKKATMQGRQRENFGEKYMSHIELLQKQKKRNCTVILIIAIATVFMSVVCLFVGSSNMTLKEGVLALFGKGTPAQIRIIQNIRLPRVLAAVIAGAGLSISGLIMQTTLNNAMASPSTLGVSNAAVFGANLSIIAFAGGFLSTGNNIRSFDAGANPYATSMMAFVFSTLSILLILGLCTFNPSPPMWWCSPASPLALSGRLPPPSCSSMPPT